jgi:RHS repeat-associated protein
LRNRRLSSTGLTDTVLRPLVELPGQLPDSFLSSEGVPTLPPLSNAQISATEPTGATTGPIVVTVGGVASNSANFTLNTGPNVYYYFEDQLGTARVITNSVGNVCYNGDYYPFGGQRAPRTDSCGWTNNYKFTGKQRDPESGLDNFGARYDSSDLGRFMSPDPGKFDERDPQSLNRYTYSRDNPLTYVDPTAMYFLVAAQYVPWVRQYISMMLGSEKGRELVA